MIPIFFAVAMAVDAIAALIFGVLFDVVGLSSLIGAAFLSAWFAPLMFFGGTSVVLVGVVLRGIGMGAQESVMRAAVAGIATEQARHRLRALQYRFWGLLIRWQRPDGISL